MGLMSEIFGHRDNITGICDICNKERSFGYLTQCDICQDLICHKCRKEIKGKVVCKKCQNNMR